MTATTTSPPPPLDLTHHYSSTSRDRKPGDIKDFYKYFTIPGIANFAGGLPHPSYFPYDTLEATVARPQRFQSPTNKEPKTDRVLVPKASHTIDPEQRIDLNTALQYATAEGYPALRSFLRRFTRDHLHPNILYAGGPEIILTCGNTDGLAKSIELFTTTWNADRDWIQQREGILCEKFSYTTAIETVRPRGLNIVGVAMDGQGMCASGVGGLADVLENWDFRRGRRPHLMYTVTIGQNPTGGTLSIERRKELYALCQKYDVIIIEDEPYWNLQYPSAYQMEARRRTLSQQHDSHASNYNASGRSSGYPFLDSLLPSYLSIDTEGRVVRLDTFSKSVAPGCRLGWITTQPAFIERLARIIEVTTQQPSGFVQSLVAGLILGRPNDENNAHDAKKTDGGGWQMDGWVRWLEGMRSVYETRMTSMCTILEENQYLFSHSQESTSMGDHSDDWEVVDRVQMFDFVWPKAGMFTWIEVLFENHPLQSRYSHEKLSEAFWVHLTRKPYLCLVGPGRLFAADAKSAAQAHRYFRTTFAPMDVDEVAPFTRRLVDGVRSFWQRKNLDGLDGDEEALLVAVQTMQLGSVGNKQGLMRDW